MTDTPPPPVNSVRAQWAALPNLAKIIVVLVILNTALSIYDTAVLHTVDTIIHIIENGQSGG